MSESRYVSWRKHLIVLEEKRCKDIFNRLDINYDNDRVIQNDVKRTNLSRDKGELEMLLHLYAHVHRSDGYVQGMNNLMAMLMHVFPSRWERWWSFTRLMVYVRPMIPEFHPKWSKWFHAHWLVKYKTILRDINRQLYDVLTCDESFEEISRLMTFRWFFIWFTQTFDKQDLLIIWDALITISHQRRIGLMCAIAAGVTSQAQEEILGFDKTERTYHIINVRASNPLEILDAVKGYY